MVSRGYLGIFLLLLLSVHGYEATQAHVRQSVTSDALSSSLAHHLATLRSARNGSPLASPHAIDEAFDAVLFSDPADFPSSVREHSDNGIDVLFEKYAVTDDIADALLSASAAGIGEWFSSRAESLRALRALPSAVEEAERADGIDTRDPALSVMDVVAAVLFGFVDGATMGMGEMYRDAIEQFKTDEVCQLHAGAVEQSFDALKHSPGQFFSGLFGSSQARNGMGRSDFVAHKLKHILTLGGSFARSVMTLTSSCSPLQTMLLPLVFLIVIGIVVTLVLFLIPGLGVVLKLAGILLSLIFGVKHLAKVGTSLAHAAGRCVAAERCAREDKIIIIESFAQLAGLLVSIVILSGLKEALRTPNLAREFSRAALLLRLRLAFTPRWSKDLSKFSAALNTARTGSKSAAKTQIKMLADDATLADDAAKVNSAKANSASQSNSAGTNTNPSVAKNNGAVEGKNLVDDVTSAKSSSSSSSSSSTVNNQAQIQAQAKIATAKSELDAAQRALAAARQREASWRPGPPREYTRAVHVGNGKYETKSFGTVSQTNPHGNAVHEAQHRVSRLRRKLADAKEEAATLVVKHADDAPKGASKTPASSAAGRNLREATGKLADDISTLGKATDDVAAIKARSCGSGAMLLDVGNVGICMVDIFQSRNEIDFSVRKLMKIKEDIKRGIINKDVVDVKKLDEALSYQMKAGIDLDVTAKSADDAALSPLVKQALGIDKPNATVNDVVQTLTKGGLEPWKARRLATELDDAVKAVQRADTRMENAKVSWVQETDPTAAALINQMRP